MLSENEEISINSKCIQKILEIKQVLTKESLINKTKCNNAKIKDKRLNKMKIKFKIICF